MKRVLVIDAQGGGLGKQIIQALKEQKLDIKITAVGTNSVATSNMLKAGADEAATGENSVIVCSKSADIIAGPIGIVIADSMLGEITDKMAVAVGKSSAQRVLVPMNNCSNSIVGAGGNSVKQLVEQAVSMIASMCQ